MQTQSSYSKACRLISILILVIGLQMGIGGLIMVQIGSVGKVRYEAASGRMLRSLSTQDRKYFNYAQWIRNAGWCCVFTGSLIGGMGVSLLMVPRLVPEFLLREKKDFATSPEGAGFSE